MQRYFSTFCNCSKNWDDNKKKFVLNNMCVCAGKIMFVKCWTGQKKERKKREKKKKKKRKKKKEKKNFTWNLNIDQQQNLI